jgi:hypothetical protein
VSSTIGCGIELFVFRFRPDVSHVNCWYCRPYNSACQRPSFTTLCAITGRVSPALDSTGDHSDLIFRTVGVAHAVSASCDGKVRHSQTLQQA